MQRDLLHLQPLALRGFCTGHVNWLQGFLLVYFAESLEKMIAVLIYRVIAQREL
jgi:hypothetical protein